MLVARAGRTLKLGRKREVDDGYRAASWNWPKIAFQVGGAMILVAMVILFAAAAYFSGRLYGTIENEAIE